MLKGGPAREREGGCEVIKGFSFHSKEMLGSLDGVIPRVQGVHDRGELSKAERSLLTLINDESRDGGFHGFLMLTF